MRRAPRLAADLSCQSFADHERILNTNLKCQALFIANLGRKPCALHQIIKSAHTQKSSVRFSAPLKTNPKKLAALVLVAVYFTPLLNPPIYYEAGALSYAYDFLLRVGYPALCLLVLRRWCAVRWSDLGFPPKVWGDYTKGEFLAYAFISTLWCMTTILVSVGLENHTELDTSKGFPLAVLGPAPVAMAFYLNVSAPLVEEIMYRGVLGWMLLSSRSSALRGIAFVALSSLLFAIGHTGHGWFGVLRTAYLGLVLALIYLRLRNIWFGMVGHFLLDYHGFVQMMKYG